MGVGLWPTHLGLDMQDLKRGSPVERLFMPVKVLKNEGRELRLRVIGGTHTTLQMFRSRLNDMDDVEVPNAITDDAVLVWDSANSKYRLDEQTSYSLTDGGNF